MPIFTIPADEWAEFCREFSGKHAGESITIEVLSGSESDPSTERNVVARNCLLHSLRLEPGGGDEDLLVFLGRHAGDEGPQFVVAPTQMRLEQPDNGDQPGRLRVDTADGQTILLYLPVPVLPGMLNGL